LLTPSLTAERPVPDASHTHGPDIIRVAYVVHTFDMGGLERCVAHLCNLLDRSRFAPMVICLNRSGAAADWIAKDDVPIVELHKRPGNDLRAVWRLARALRHHGVDVVHSHNWGTLVETSIARRWAGTPVHVHAERGTLLGELDVRGWRRRVRAMAMRWTLRRVDAVVSNAQSIAERIQAACGFPAERVVLIPNGVKAPRVDDVRESGAKLRRQWSIPQEAFVVGSVGRLVPVKGFATAIDSIARLPAAGREIHLVLVGDGPQREALATQAAASGVSHRVHLIGWRNDIGDCLAAMDCYLNSSVSEGMSQSILEAMAIGLPMVVTDVGDNAILVNGDRPCGTVVPPNDPAAMSGALTELLQAPAHREMFAENSWARYRRCYTVGVMVRAYEEFYGGLHPVVRPIAHNPDR
jgi:glycosyltransferase involved in cell wall biosynthesis